MCITILHNFCVNEGNVSINSIEVNQGSDREILHTDVNESGLAESSVVGDMIVQALVKCEIERPACS